MNGPNTTHMAMLMGAFALPIVVIGALVNFLAGGGVLGFVVVVVIAVLVTFIAYRQSDAVVLAASGARPADPDAYPRLYNLMEGLCITAGVPEPRLYVIQDDAPNALTTGRGPGHAAIAVTTGLLEKLNRIELEAILAHEISHIRNDDISVETVAVTTGGIGVLITDLAFRTDGASASNGDAHPEPASIPRFLGYPFLLVAPLSARALQFATAKDREQAADMDGVGLTRYPPGLIAALEKVRHSGKPTRAGTRATAHLWLENPLDEASGDEPTARFAAMSDAHPPLEERIERLREL